MKSWGIQYRVLFAPVSVSPCLSVPFPNFYLLTLSFLDFGNHSALQDMKRKLPKPHILDVGGFKRVLKGVVRVARILGVSSAGGAAF